MSDRSQVGSRGGGSAGAGISSQLFRMTAFFDSGPSQSSGHKRHDKNKKGQPSKHQRHPAIEADDLEATTIEKMVVEVPRHFHMGIWKDFLPPKSSRSEENGKEGGNTVMTNNDYGMQIKDEKSSRRRREAMPTPLLRIDDATNGSFLASSRRSQSPRSISPKHSSPSARKKLTQKRSKKALESVRLDQSQREERKKKFLEERQADIVQTFHELDVKALKASQKRATDEQLWQQKIAVAAARVKQVVKEAKRFHGESVSSSDDEEEEFEGEDREAAELKKEAQRRVDEANRQWKEKSSPEKKRQDTKATFEDNFEEWAFSTEEGVFVDQTPKEEEKTRSAETEGEAKEEGENTHAQESLEEETVPCSSLFATYVPEGVSESSALSLAPLFAIVDGRRKEIIDALATLSTESTKGSAIEKPRRSALQEKQSRKGERGDHNEQSDQEEAAKMRFDKSILESLFKSSEKLPSFESALVTVADLLLRGIRARQVFVSDGAMKLKSFAELLEESQIDIPDKREKDEQFEREGRDALRMILERGLEKRRRRGAEALFSLYSIGFELVEAKAKEGSVDSILKKVDPAAVWKKTSSSSDRNVVNEREDGAEVDKRELVSPQEQRQMTWEEGWKRAGVTFQTLLRLSVVSLVALQIELSNAPSSAASDEPAIIEEKNTAVTKNDDRLNSPLCFGVLHAVKNSLRLLPSMETFSILPVYLLDVEDNILPHSFEEKSGSAIHDLRSTLDGKNSENHNENRGESDSKGEGITTEEKKLIIEARAEEEEKARRALFRLYSGFVLSLLRTSVSSDALLLNSVSSSKYTSREREERAADEQAGVDDHVKASKTDFSILNLFKSTAVDKMDVNGDDIDAALFSLFFELDSTKQKTKDNNDVQQQSSVLHCLALEGLSATSFSVRSLSVQIVLAVLQHFQQRCAVSNSSNRTATKEDFSKKKEENDISREGIVGNEQTQQRSAFSALDQCLRQLPDDYFLLLCRSVTGSEARLMVPQRDGQKIRQLLRWKDFCTKLAMSLLTTKTFFQTSQSLLSEGSPTVLQKISIDGRLAMDTLLFAVQEVGRLQNVRVVTMTPEPCRKAEWKEDGPEKLKLLSFPKKGASNGGNESFLKSSTVFADGVPQWHEASGQIQSVDKNEADENDPFRKELSNLLQSYVSRYSLSDENGQADILPFIYLQSITETFCSLFEEAFFEKSTKSLSQLLPSLEKEIDTANAALSLVLLSNMLKNSNTAVRSSSNDESAESFVEYFLRQGGISAVDSVLSCPYAAIRSQALAVMTSLAHCLRDTAEGSERVQRKRLLTIVHQRLSSTRAISHSLSRILRDDRFNGTVVQASIEFIHALSGAEKVKGIQASAEEDFCTFSVSYSPVGVRSLLKAGADEALLFSLRSALIGPDSEVDQPDIHEKTAADDCGEGFNENQSPEVLHRRVLALFRPAPQQMWSLLLETLCALVCDTSCRWRLRDKGAMEFAKAVIKRKDQIFDSRPNGEDLWMLFSAFFAGLLGNNQRNLQTEKEEDDESLPAGALDGRRVLAAAKGYDALEDEAKRRRDAEEARLQRERELELEQLRREKEEEARRMEEERNRTEREEEAKKKEEEDKKEEEEAIERQERKERQKKKMKSRKSFRLREMAEDPEAFAQVLSSRTDEAQKRFDEEVRKREREAKIDQWKKEGIFEPVPPPPPSSTASLPPRRSVFLRNAKREVDKMLLEKQARAERRKARAEEEADHPRHRNRSDSESESESSMESLRSSFSIRDFLDSEPPFLQRAEEDEQQSELQRSTFADWLLANWGHGDPLSTLVATEQAQELWQEASQMAEEVGQETTLSLTATALPIPSTKASATPRTAQRSYKRKLNRALREIRASVIKHRLEEKLKSGERFDMGDAGEYLTVQKTSERIAEERTRETDDEVGE